MTLPRVVLVIAAVLLAGCSDGQAPEPIDQGGDASADRMDIVGSVRDADLLPLLGNVTLVEAEMTIPTQADGSFRFEDLPVDFYTVTASAPEHAAQTLTVAPGSNETLVFTLAQFQAEPSSETVRFEGRMQCAAEYVIISGPCDRILTEFDGPQVIDQTSVFDVAVGPEWRTLVVDVVFDGQPGLDGLRVTAKGVNQSDALGSYVDYGKFHGSESYTFRLAPGGTYDGGSQAVPINATTIRFDVFGQGHGHGTVCDPTDTYACFLGVGAATDVRFELFVTAFFVEPAPPGFSVQ